MWPTTKALIKDRITELNKMDYSFLNSITLKDTGRLRVPKERNPESGIILRILANGEVYPSRELVNKFDLEYRRKSQSKGFGIDVIDSKDWPVFKDAPRMIIFGLTPKTEPKVDLFGTCRYDEEGNPKSSVMDQGSKSETLLNLVKSMGYLTEEQKYVDLEFVMSHPIKMQDGIANIPKVYERESTKNAKGSKTSIRRENVVFYPINTPENLKAVETAPTVNEVVTTN